MWKYRRVNTLQDKQWTLFFHGVPLLISSKNVVLSEVSKELEDKMKQVPHIFQNVEEEKKQEVKTETEEKVVVKKVRRRKVNKNNENKE